MKMTQQEKNGLANELRRIADKLDKGMVIEDFQYEWEVLDRGLEMVYLDYMDPRTSAGFAEIQVRPARVRYQLNMIAQPEMVEQDEEKPKKKKKKGGKKK